MTEIINQIMLVTPPWQELGNLTHDPFRHSLCILGGPSAGKTHIQRQIDSLFIKKDTDVSTERPAIYISLSAGQGTLAGLYVSLLEKLNAPLKFRERMNATLQLQESSFQLQQVNTKLVILFSNFTRTSNPPLLKTLKYSSRELQMVNLTSALTLRKEWPVSELSLVELIAKTTVLMVFGNQMAT
jgi:hypothetical protein